MTEEVQTFEETFEPDKEFMVSSLETLKVISDPVRLRILESLIEKPLTVKEVAARLGTTATKLYYHVNLMEEHGLLRVVSQRIVSGIIEKQYRTRAFSFDVDKELLSISTGEEGGAIDLMLKAVFNSTSDDVRQAIDLGLLNPSENDPSKRNGIIFRSVTKIRRSQVREFQERLLALTKEFNNAHTAIEHEAEDENDPSMPYGFTVALFPFPYELPSRQIVID